jgi:hypothetical protein
MNKQLRTLSIDDTAISRQLGPGQVGTTADHNFLIVRSDDVFVLAALAEQLAEEELLNMASFRRVKTGVANTIWASYKGRHCHAARIKVAIDPPDSLDPAGESASFTIHDGEVVAGNPPIWLRKQVAQFIALNREALMDLWEGRIDSGELGDRLRPIEGR